MLTYASFPSWPSLAQPTPRYSHHRRAFIRLLDLGISPRIYLTTRYYLLNYIMVNIDEVKASVDAALIAANASLRELNRQVGCLASTLAEKS